VTEKVSVEDRGAVRILRIVRPDQRNCVDGETADALARAIDAFAADARSRVLVVAGEGDAAFCAGADLKAAASLFQHEHVDRAGPMGFARLDPGKPTLAAIEGYCFAGGMELAAWCDVRIGAEGAEFGCLSRRFGIPYVDGGTQRFPRILGTGNALHLLLTGARIDARRAYEMGFLQELVPRGRALERALELAATIAGYPNALRLEARVVRPALMGPDGGISTEIVEALIRFAQGKSRGG